MGITNFGPNAGINIGTGLYVGLPGAETQIINSSGAFVGTITFVNISTSGNTTLGNGASDTTNVNGTLTVGSAASTVTHAVNGSLTVTGSVTAASLIPSGATVPTNGIYLSAANTLAFATNGATAGNISATKNWTLGSSTSANLHSINGAIAITASGNANFGLEVTTGSSGFGGAASHYAIFCDPAFSTTVTAQADCFRTNLRTPNSSYTLALATAYNAAGITKGAASTITRSINYYGTEQTVATYNAFLSNSDGFTASHFIYYNGTNPSSFSGPIANAKTDLASTATAALIAVTSSTGLLKITGTAATVIAGIVKGVNGQKLRIYNASTGNLTLNNADGSAATADQITTLTGGNVNTTGVGVIDLFYDSTTSKWIVAHITA